MSRSPFPVPNRGLRATCLALALSTGWPSLPAQASAPPNFLVIVADDLGYEALESYGGQEFSTPHLHKLARGGIQLNRAYASPVCTPSRMTLYTGQYAVNHGFDSVIPVHRGTTMAVDFDPYPSIARRLRKAGYATAVTGKWQLATLEFHPEHIRTAGFDSWCVWQIWRDGAKTTRYWDPCFNHDGRIREDIADRFGPDVLADYVVARMEDALDRNRPFYIHHNMLLPHWPIIQTPPQKRSGEPASLGAMIAYLDELVGRLLRAVDQLGIRESTWVLFLGDNGTDAKSPRRTNNGLVTGGKHHFVDAGIHIPAILRGPGQFQAGGSLEDLVDIADFFPTISELAGLEHPLPERLDGVSFARRLLDRSMSSARNYVTAGFKGDDSVFDGAWRLHRRGNVLVDCRELPAETPAQEGDPEAAAARQRLEPWLREIRRPSREPHRRSAESE